MMNRYNRHFLRTKVSSKQSIKNNTENEEMVFDFKITEEENGYEAINQDSSIEIEKINENNTIRQNLRNRNSNKK